MKGTEKMGTSNPDSKEESEKEKTPLQRFPEDEKILTSLDPTHQEIFNQAAVHLANGRWWNLWHIVLSIDFLNRIITAEEKKKTAEGTGDVSRDVLFPALILHDCGWDKNVIGASKTLSSPISPQDVDTSWERPELRIAHMDMGREIASTVLHNTGYVEHLKNKGMRDPAGSIREIIHIVGTHDNVYVPGEVGPQTVNEKIHRDADACFIVTGLSFWKDYKIYAEQQRTQEQEIVSPDEYLEERNRKYGQRETEEGKKIFAEEVQKRKIEIADRSKNADEWLVFYKEQADARNTRALVGGKYIP